MTHPGTQYLAEQLQAAYDKVKEWPENSVTGFMDLITLRNLVPDAIDHLASEKARADAAEAERDTCIKAMDAIADDDMKHLATIASLTEQLAEAREATRQMHRRAQQAERVTEIGKGILKMWLEYFRSCKTPRKERFLFIYALREIDRRLSRLEKQEGEA